MKRSGAVFLAVSFFGILVSCGQVDHGTVTPVNSSVEEFASPWNDSVPHAIIHTRCILVLDGDTFKTSDDEMIRLLGINAPEIAHPGHGKFEGERFGVNAHEALRGMIAGESVTLIIPHANSRDKFGRYLAIVLLESRFDRSAPVCANIELLRSGLAHLFFMGDSSSLNEKVWYAAQDEARHARRGIWTLTPSEMPDLAFDTRNSVWRLNM